MSSGAGRLRRYRLRRSGPRRGTGIGVARRSCHPVEFLDYADGVVEYGVPLRRDLTRVIRKHRPELLITLNHHTTWGGSSWNSPDHRAVGRAVLDAAGDAGNRWIFRELEEVGLAPWRGVRWVAVAASPHGMHAVDVSDQLERAASALAAHEAYLSALSDDPPEKQARAIIEETTSAAAQRFGGRFAVSFELIAL